MKRFDIKMEKNEKRYMQGNGGRDVWRIDKIDKIIKNDKVAIGTHTMFGWGNGMLTELYGTVGFDMVWIDTEHGAIDKSALMSTLIGCAVNNMAAFVRVAWKDKVLAKPILDMGADGIIFPMVLNAEQAEEAVAACQYPPDGVRGWGPVRNMKYGAVGLEEYKIQAKKVWTVIQIEDIKAVEHLDEILKVKGVNAIIVGPCDLSGSMGLMGQTDHPELKKTIDYIAQKAREYHMPFGTSTGYDEQTLTEWVERGANFMFVDHECGYVYRGAKNTYDCFSRIIKEHKV